MIPNYGLFKSTRNQISPFEEEHQNRQLIDPTTLVNQSLPSQTPKPLSITDKINEILANRPDREALRAGMQNAPKREDYKPNKLSRIGAILAGASTGFRNPAAGVEVAQNIIDRPFNEANATYDKHLRDLGVLAGMEGEDVRTKISGVGMQEDSDWKSKTFNENVRQHEQGYDLDKKKFTQSGWYDVKNNVTGKMERRNSVSGEVQDIGKVNLTPDEEMQMDIKKFRATQGAEGAADRKSRKDIADAQIEGRKSIEAVKAANKQILGKMSIGADEAVRRMYLDLGNAVNTEGTLLSGLDLQEYIEADPVTGVPRIKEDAKSDKTKANIVGLLQNFLKTDAGQSKGAQPNSEVQSILDEYRNQNKQPVVPPPTGRGGRGGL